MAAYYRPIHQTWRPSISNLLWGSIQLSRDYMELARCTSKEEHNLPFQMD